MTILGEKSLKVGEKTYILRLEFELIKKFELQFGPRTIWEFFGYGFPPATEIVYILCGMAGIKEKEAFSIINTLGVEEVLATIKEVGADTLNPEKTVGEEKGEKD